MHSLIPGPLVQESLAYLKVFEHVKTFSLFVYSLEFKQISFSPTEDRNGFLNKNVHEWHMDTVEVMATQ